jgi:hypothetical protein
MSHTLEVPETPTALLDMMLDPAQTVLGDNRESWEQIDTMRLGNRSYTPKARRDGYAYPHVADICAGSATVIKALHTLLSSETLPGWLETKVFKTPRGSLALSVYINTHGARYCRCGLTADSHQFSPWGTRTLKGVAVVASPTSIGLVTSLQLLLSTPHRLRQEILNQPPGIISNGPVLDDHFVIDTNELGHVQSHVAYARYNRDAFLRQQIGMKTPTYTMYSTGVLPRDDERTGFGNISAFTAQHLPVIAMHLERMLHHDAMCPSANPESEEEGW